MILVSACLLGQLVRYKGDGCEQELLTAPEVRKHLVTICPECAGGLPTPRPPAEIQGAGGGSGVWQGTAKVINNIGQDVTKAYCAGAQEALQIARTQPITAAILKERSPSCGTHAIYDGSFSGRKLAGQGVAAAALAQAGIPLYSEEELTPALIKHLLEQDKRFTQK
ncbi:DUF523 domain-containing protein [Phascolarctobacterium sp.]